jgi:RNA polymerase sigma factor (sigma-70 family)
MTTRVAKVVGVAGVEWAQLYERLWPSLARALTAATGSYEGVEDAVQDAFAAAMTRNPATMRSVEGWLFVTALNAFRRARRRDALLRRLQLRHRPLETPDQTIVRADLVRGLARLSSRERELLIAKYYIGLQQDEIARAFGLKRSAAAMAISRAAAHFRALEGTS